MSNYLNTILNSYSVVSWDTRAHTVPVGVTRYNWARCSSLHSLPLYELPPNDMSPTVILVTVTYHFNHFCHREMVKNCPSQSMQREIGINCNYLSDTS